jgi:hypothetical protein
MKISAFNTNRGYSANGQRIAWTQLASGNIAMVDIDRGLDYVLAHRADIPPTNGTVLALYDANKSAPFNMDEYQEARALAKTLRDAAGAVLT